MKIFKLNLTNLDEKSSTDLIVENVGIAEEDFKPFGYKEDEEKPEYTASELKAQIQEAYQKGLTEGKNLGVQETTQAVLSVEQSAEQGVQSILTQLTTALSEIESQKAAFKQDMSKLTHHVIKKILDEKIKEDFDELILKAFEQILPIISKEPKIEIIMETNLLEKVQPKIHKVITDNKFKGEIEFIPDPSCPPETCRVEWSSSGINFDLKEKIKEIDEIINEYIKSI